MRQHVRRQQRWHHAGRGVAQLGDAAGQRLRDPRQRAWVVAVQHQQLKQRFRIAPLQIARAVGDSAVEQTQYQREANIAIQRAGGEGLRQRIGQRGHALNVATNR